MQEKIVSERRGCPRVGFYKPVEFQFTTSGHQEGSLALDISEMGIKIDFNDFIPLNTELNLTIPLMAESFLACTGQVVWIEKLPYTDRYRGGIKFLQNESFMPIKRAIRDFVLNRFV